MIYGIDLGTTNSLIGRHGAFLSGLIPSIADIVKNTAGEQERSNLSATRSFKTDISMGAEGKVSVGASALVLKELVRVSCMEVKDVVISVPAYFTTNQREATREAAKLAGLEVRALVNEPTAAAMYYCQDARKLTLVFDLGGGTFDVSVIDGRGGVYDVQDTAGLVTGGDDFDKAIFNDMCKKCNFKTHRATQEAIVAATMQCTEAKIKVQQTGETVTISNELLDKDYQLTVLEYTNIMKRVFRQCLIKTIEVKNRTMNYGSDFDLMFVGGSTRCPYLRRWVEEELGVKGVEFTYDPDKVVGLGAAYYAHLLEEGKLEDKLKDVTKPIGVALADGTMRIIIPQGSKIPIEESEMFTNPEEALGLDLRMYQGASLIVKNNAHIGDLRYDFGETKEALTANVEVIVRVDKSGFINVTAKEFGKPEVKISLMM
jgi:molecular chaperone DnaK (HSP70)